MRLFTARRFAFAVLVPALFLVSFVPGCSNESEGERCETAGDDSECQSGLVCKPVNDNINRCCYADRVSDSRCLAVGNTSATGSTSDAGTKADATSNGEAGAAGSTGAPVSTGESGAAGSGDGGT